MSRQAREKTCEVLDLVDQGVLTAQQVMEACLSYMSESEVADMARINGFTMSEEDEE